MNIKEDNPDLDREKTLKVRLPKRLHLKLHTTKILTGTTISDNVEEALNLFFDEETRIPENVLPDGDPGA